MIVADDGQTLPVRKTQGYSASQPSSPQSPQSPHDNDQPPPAYPGPAQCYPSNSNIYQPQFYHSQFPDSSGALPPRPSAPPMGPSTPVFASSYRPPSQERRESTAARFIKAFLTALLIYILLAMFTRSIVDLAEDSGRHRSPGHGANWDDGDWGSDVWPSEPSLPHPPKGAQFVSCVQGERWDPVPQTETALDSYLLFDRARTKFELPIDSALFLLSRGSNSHGSLHVSQADEWKGEWKARVEVTATFRSRSGLGRAHVCLMRREDGGNGVGVFTPTQMNIPYHERLEFEIKVFLPPSSSDAPLTIPSFETDLHNWFHKFGEIHDSVFFQSLSLKTTNAAVEAVGLHALKAKVESSNGPIHGYYNVTKSLELVTSNSIIDAAVDLYNDVQGSPSFLRLQTTNGPIKSSVSLHSADSTGERGRFRVGASTTNNVLTLDMPRSPVDSELTLTAGSTNGPAHVSLPAAFEGSFSLSTSNRSPMVERREEVEDPSGKGRKRTVEISSVNRGSMRGMVYWNERAIGEARSKGTVEVSTTNSPVQLTI